MPRRLILPLALLLCTAAARAADLPFLHPLFADHMVLQRDVSAPVWGWTTPGAEVKVSLAGQTVAATADDKGRWFARLAPLPAGGPYWMTVNGPQVRFLEDVLVGDVWLCSGQSNMEMGIGAIGAPQDIAAAANPKLRLFMADHRVAGEPQPLVGGTWKPCNPQSVTEGGWAGFSAVGYFFGRHVQQALDIPVGLIQTCWGGTVAEAWVSGEALRTMPDFAGTVDGFRAQLRSPDTFEAQMAEYWKQHDPGTSASPAWSDPAFDDVAWKTMPLPNAWENAGLPGFEGLVWFRKSVDLPADWAGQDLVLHLGPVDDRDTTYFNGTPVGGLDEWNLPRDYRVPGSLVKAGRNVIAVRVLDTGGAGGLYGQAGDLRLERPGQAALALAGDWRYRDSTPMSGLPGPPQRFGNDPNLVTVLYNGMVAPLVPFGVRGAIWYQGESNAARPKQYRTLLPTLIRDWRSRFGVGEFPFLIVQLANFMAVRPEPAVPHHAGDGEGRHRAGHRHRRRGRRAPQEQAGSGPPAGSGRGGCCLRPGGGVLRAGLPRHEGGGRQCAAAVRPRGRRAGGARGQTARLRGLWRRPEVGLGRGAGGWRLCGGIVAAGAGAGGGALWLGGQPHCELV
ncbi:MAG: hypothetical protein HYU66_07730 [Armatimonadetes bacterium]|nr:hypothetical protein [Armatimonadota bacterium]